MISFYDPCSGHPTKLDKDGKRGQAFYSQYPTDNKNYSEIQVFRDCKDFEPPETGVQWVISNPPFSSDAYKTVANCSFKYSDNVVFLVRLDTALGTTKRHNMYLEHNLSLKEIIPVRWDTAGFPQKRLRACSYSLEEKLYW